MKISLGEKQSWTLDQKIFHFFEVIDLFYAKTEGKVYIAFSGGKDSTLLTYLCDEWCRMMKIPEFPLVFNNTTNEYQEILEFVKTFGDRVTWLRPKITFAQSLQKNGFPLVGKETAQKINEIKSTKSDRLRDIRLNGKIRISKATGKEYVGGKLAEKWKYLIYEDIELTAKCCDILKKAPVKKFEKETGLSPIIGTIAAESELRKSQYQKIGYCNDFTGERFKSKPLSIFTEKDIWDLIEKFQIEICSVYYSQIIDGVEVEGESRTGCAYCGFGVQFEDPENTKFHRLQKREPKRWLSMMDKLGYRKALSLLNIKFSDQK